MKPVYFASAQEFREWLQSNHSRASEIQIGFYSKASGRQSISYAGALDEALCFGWIDGIVHKVDAQRHTRRFTPRRSESVWSLINIEHVNRLTALGRMHPAGLAAFARRKAGKTGVYSFEKRPEKLPPRLEAVFRANEKAWLHWIKQPPGYQRTAMWWVISAKREDTQSRRLSRLIAVSAEGRRLA